MLDEKQIQCPYCGERISVLVDHSSGSATYIEDCQVCCRPIEFSLKESCAGSWSLLVSRDDE